MKKELLLTLLCLSVITVNAQVLKTDFFSGYMVGTEIEKAEYSDATASVAEEAKLNQWSRSGKLNTEIFGTNPLAVTPLTYPEYINSGKDVAIELTPVTAVSATDARTTIYTLAANGTTYLPYGSTFYLGFLFKVASVPTDPVKAVEFFSFAEDHRGQNLRQRVGVINSSGDPNKYKIGIAVAKEASITNLSPTIYDIGQTHLVVLKISFDGQDPMKNGSVSMYIDPVKSTTEPTPSLTYSVIESLGAVLNFKNLRGITARQLPNFSGTVGSFILTDSWSQLWANNTAISNLSTDSEVKSIKYYNLSGLEMITPLNNFTALENGVYIQKVKYNNGKIETTKVVKNR